MRSGRGMGASLVASSAIAVLTQSGPSLGHHAPVLDSLGSSWTRDAGEMMMSVPGWQDRYSLEQTP